MEPFFTFTLREGQAGFAALMDAIEAALAAQSIPDKIGQQIMVALDEVVSNVLEYGDATEVAILIQGEPGQVMAEIADNGRAFDPLALAEPNTSLSVDEREIGGLGVHLVRRLMSNVSYERQESWNRLRFDKSYGLEA